MTLRTVAAAFAALALAAGPASATPAEVRDAAGDWALASQDIVRVRLERATVDGSPGIRAVLTLAAAPAPSDTYLVRFGHGCVDWMLGTSHPANGGGPFFGRSRCRPSTPVAESTSVPATMTVSGTEVVISAKLALDLRRGQWISGVEGQSAHGMPSVVYFPDDTVTNGDYAAGAVRFRA